MHPLLTVSYWTSLLPPPTFDPIFLYAVIGLFVFCLAVGIAMRVLAKRLEDEAFWGKAAPKFGTALISMSILGFIHLWIAYEQVYLLGARFWLLVWALALGAWLIKDVHYTLKVLPKLEEEYEEKMRIAKYLPKSH